MSVLAFLRRVSPLGYWPPRLVGRLSASAVVGTDNATFEVLNPNQTITLGQGVKRVTVKDLSGSASPNISVTSELGTLLESPSAPGVIASFSTTATIATQGQSITWQWDGVSFSIIHLSVASPGGAPASPQLVRVNAGGTGGAKASPYNAKPFDTVIADLSTGNVQVNAPTLLSGQWFELGQDEGTAWTTQTLTLVAPAGSAIAQPVPNNGTFTAASGSLVFPIAPATAAQTKGFLQRWANVGSAAGYLCK